MPGWGWVSKPKRSAVDPKRTDWIALKSTYWIEFLRKYYPKIMRNNCYLRPFCSRHHRAVEHRRLSQFDPVWSLDGEFIVISSIGQDGVLNVFYYTDIWYPKNGKIEANLLIPCGLKRG